jgi:hypothetical protein
MHICRSVCRLLPDLIAAGLDISNPVRFTDANTELACIKKDFGKVLIFLTYVGYTYFNIENIKINSL